MSNNVRTRDRKPQNFVDGLKVRGVDIEELIPGIGKTALDGAAPGAKGLLVEKQLEKMKISDTTLSQYNGVYRYLNTTGGINWYFLFSAINNSSYFTQQSIKRQIEAALHVGLVATFEQNTFYRQYQKVVINGKLFMVNIEGVSGSTIPNVASITQESTFVSNGTLTLEYIGKPFGSSTDLPVNWQWFLVDIKPGLYNAAFPDSTDSYSAMLALISASIADKDWLQTKPGVGNYTNWDLLKLTVNASCVSGVSNNLSYTFQNSQGANNSTYNIQFVADNSEVYAGLISMVKMARLVNDTQSVTFYQNSADIIKTGILSLYDSANNRFKTYFGETEYPVTPSYSRFVSKDRFSIFPWKFGVLNENEVEQYGISVLRNHFTSYPTIFRDSELVDSFGMLEWFDFTAKAMCSEEARLATLRRVSVRDQSQLTITDLATVAPFIGVFEKSHIDVYTSSNINTINNPSNNAIVVLPLNVNKEVFYIVAPSNNIASLTVVLPRANNGQKVNLAFTNNISTLNVTAEVDFSGNAVTVPFSSIAVGTTTPLRFIYHSASNKWVLI